MNFSKIPLVALLVLSVTGLLGAVPSLAQGQSTALERGYRTGYSDGYTAGYRDVTVGSARDYQSKEDYQKADRSYNDVWGPIEDYRDGYQQGFEAGYGAGYARQQFNSTLPAGLKRRNTGGTPAPVTTDNPTTSTSTSDSTNPGTVSTGSVSIPQNTILTLELLTPLSTDATQRGDRFEARVTEPNEFGGFVVEGRVTTVKRPGKVKGVAELQLSFEQIRSTDNRTATFRAELIELVGLNGEVDSEGGVKGRDSTKDDAVKVSGAAGIGAVIGAIAGGGKGAAIGAVIGGGAGTAGVMTQRGKEIRLDRGQLLKVRTSTDTGVL